MKIAIVRQRYNPYGGAERFVERALGALASEGAEVTLITRSWDGAPREGFRQITCDPSYSRLFGGRAARDRSFANCARREMAQGGFDITQSHERIPGCMIFRAGDGVHAAWLDHRARVLTPLQRLSQRWSGYHRYVQAAERAMFADPALRAVICNSQMVADEIERYYAVDRSKLPVIYNGVDTAVFHPGLADEFRQTMRAQAGIARRAPVLLFVGSGFERKGVPQLLRAAARMRRVETRLVIVGADRKLAAMQALAARLGLAGRVYFTGPLKDVRPWYGAADGFVLPTLYDPCPNAALEALACGLPIVTSTTCGAQEWVRPGKNGWVVDAVDNVELADRLDDLAALAGDPAARAAARAVAEPLTLPAMADRLLALYRSLGRPQGGRV
ncbi:glycosyltransferase family 4 protein [Dechloromonas denitrificans]|uniref:glycosyltransferase family 4 protein n=1 Tax=Dechloromonas denitrificans TaxID=281362 RepID=UPI001CF87A27|nr:glycosyltransferase family 4 protein [Dechloromonas denitrificans]UCV03830.1 glycosyltransferase family 4 protein [Dechloromonas denitrificans]